MALVFADGMALYTDINSASLVKGWTTNVSANSGQYRNPGRQGAGSYCAYLYNYSPAGYMSRTLSLSGTTSIVGFAIQPGSIAFPMVTLYNGTCYVTVWYTSTQGLNVSYGNAAPPTSQGSQTSLSTIANLTLGASNWYYVELQVTWSATVGRVILRVDTTQYYDSGATLNVGAANATQLSFNWNNFSSASANYGSPYFTDVIVMDGSGTSLNAFQGDVRVETLLPSADGANLGWTRTPNVNLLQNANISRLTTDVSGWSVTGGASPTITRTATPISTGGSAVDSNKFPNAGTFLFSGSNAVFLSVPNAASGFAVIPGHVLGVGAWMSANQNMQLGLRFYDNAGVQVGPDVIGFTSYVGTWIACLGTVTVPVGAVTAALFIKSSATGFNLSATGFMVCDGLTSYAYSDPGTAHYWNMVEATHDGDQSYVYTNTLNAKETFKTSSLLSTVGTILAVQETMVARKESATARVLTPVVRVSGTDYQGSVTFSPGANQAYGPSSNLWVTSPATSTAWTRAEVNAMELGVQLTT